jgi:hypothetical protein
MAVVAVACLAESARAEDLTGQVAAALRDSGAMAGYRVNVKAKDGTVWLTGTVKAPEQIAAAVGLAEKTPGVERVVNRLTVARAEAGGATDGRLPDPLALPASIRAMAGLGAEPVVQLVAAPSKPKAPANARKKPAKAAANTSPAGVKSPAPRQKASSPRPLNTTTARPIPLRGQGVRSTSRQAVRTSAEGEPMTLPMPAEYGDEGLVDGQMVPGSERIIEGGPIDGPMVGGGLVGQPVPMGATGVGMPPVPMRGSGPNMPNYAWPSYSAYPNYAALQYPTQYSPTAWPYIGPFYPYPQVPLGWRRVSLEWDDGWWFLDFDDRHHHSHRR